MSGSRNEGGLLGTFVLLDLVPFVGIIARRLFSYLRGLASLSTDISDYGLSPLIDMDVLNPDILVTAVT
jgi:hypothetical protein